MGVLSEINKILFGLTGYHFAKHLTSHAESDIGRISECHRRDEAWGVWSNYTINKYANLVEKIPGDFAEIGVARGATFFRIARIAASHGKMAHAIDSFRGMAEPGEHDRKPGEKGAHYRGEFSSGGVDEFVRLMAEKHVSRDLFQTWEGFIPECFDKVPSDKRFSLVILDVDHYKPTHDSLLWVWPRINTGGYLLLDDCALHWDKESTKAIKEFLATEQAYWISDYYNNQLILQKIAN